MEQQRGIKIKNKPTQYTNSSTIGVPKPLGDRVEEFGGVDRLSNSQSPVKKK